jgi:hypothetical protein
VPHGTEVCPLPQPSLPKASNQLCRLPSQPSWRWKISIFPAIMVMGSHHLPSHRSDGLTLVKRKWLIALHAMGRRYRNQPHHACDPPPLYQGSAAHRLLCRRGHREFGSERVSAVTPKVSHPRSTALGLSPPWHLQLPPGLQNRRTPTTWFPMRSVSDMRESLVMELSRLAWPAFAHSSTVPFTSRHAHQGFARSIHVPTVIRQL